MRLNLLCFVGSVLLLSCSDTTGPARSGVRRLMVSENVVCALDASGIPTCWGQNTSFWEYAAPPGTLPGSVNARGLSVQRLKWLADGVGTHLCGITEERDAVCWARGTHGQLGRGVLGDTGNPAALVSGSHAWAEISVGRLTTCGLTTDGTAYCWGLNQFGEIGDSAVPIAGRTADPRPVMGDFKFKQIVAGWLHTCGITTTDKTYCWGSNSSGQLGVGTVDTARHRVPEEVIGGHTFKALALGSRYTCGLNTDGTAYCWGTNGTGQLGDGSTTDRAAPESVHTQMKFEQIAAGSGFASSSNVPPPVQLQGGVGHTCALTATGKAFCWGWNGDGQVGNSSLDDQLSPVAVATDVTFESIGLSSANTCAMRGNAVWCWGSNLRGQLGRSTGGASAVNPILLPTPFNKP